MNFDYDRRKQAIALVRFDSSTIAKWKSDLKRLTVIYRSIGRGDEVAARKAQSLFAQFSKNFRSMIQQVLTGNPVSFESARRLRHSAEHAGAVMESRPFPWRLDDRTGWSVLDMHSIDLHRNEYIRECEASFDTVWEDLEAYFTDNSSSEPGDAGVVRYPKEERIDVGGVRLVIDHSARVPGHPRDYQNDDLIRKLVHGLPEWCRAIEHKFPRVTAGLTVFLSLGEGLSLSHAAEYDEARDTVSIVNFMGVGSDEFIHEIGHRFWSRFLSAKAREHWRDTIKSRQGKLTAEDVRNFFKDVWLVVREEGRHYAPRSALVARVLHLKLSPEKAAAYLFLANGTGGYERLGSSVEVGDYTTDADTLKLYLDYNVGASYQIDTISDYGATGYKEAFAEAFKLYVTKGPRALTPWNRWFFEEISRIGGARLATQCTTGADGRLLSE